jgi:hypothetical protein
MGFLCVSLGSSTVQLHDSPDTDAHAHIERLVSVVKMATVLEEYTSEEQRSVVLFCGQKDSMQRIFMKKRFLFMVGSTYPQSGSHLGGKRSADDKEVETEVAETTVKIFLCCGFRRTGKTMAQMYVSIVSMLVEDMWRNKCFY